jgi:hypothetical protein
MGEQELSGDSDIFTLLSTMPYDRWIQVNPLSSFRPSARYKVIFFNSRVLLVLCVTILRAEPEIVLKLLSNIHHKILISFSFLYFGPNKIAGTLT